MSDYIVTVKVSLLVSRHDVGFCLDREIQDYIRAAVERENRENEDEYAGNAPTLYSRDGAAVVIMDVESTK